MDHAIIDFGTVDGFFRVASAATARTEIPLSHREMPRASWATWTKKLIWAAIPMISSFAAYN